MRGLCNLPLDLMLWASLAFIGTALVIGVMSAFKSITNPASPSDVFTRSNQPIAPIIEALKGLIEALGKAPAWFALFLAGLFLFWLSGEVYVDACKPTASAAKSSTSKATTTLIEKTVQKGR
jgi:hypothetical protein